MCGIAGEVALGTNGATDIDRATPMLRALLHRGPDGLGGWEDRDRRWCALHARLALLDVRHGGQPMLAADAGAVIAFNGELYGFERQRRQLEARGAVFRTGTDTEVALQLYRHGGRDWIEQMEGEFAFALFDWRSGETILARDRFGVKPLFVSLRGGLLLFASEIKAILAHPWSDRRLDRVAIRNRLHGVFLPGETVFEGIESIEPGMAWTVSRSGIRQRRYFDLDPGAVGSFRASAAAATEAFDAAFQAAVDDRLRADVPVGQFLSGGIDSAAVAAYARRTAEPLKAFILDFNGDRRSEAQEALATARSVGADAEVVSVKADDLAEAFRDSVWHAEIPVANPHGAAKLLLARQARRSVKAVLTGEGADELHGGYDYFRHAALLANGSPAALRDFLQQHGVLEGIAPRATQELCRSHALRPGGAAPYAAVRAALLERRLRPFLRPAPDRAQPGPPSRVLVDWLRARSPLAAELGPVGLSQLAALLTDLPGYNLQYLSDRVEMAAGLEGRLPFLDSRVAGLLWSLPPELHVGPDAGKLVLRAAMRLRLPAFGARKKKMFAASSAMALATVSGPLGREWLSSRITREAGIFRPLALGAALRLLRHARTDSPLVAVGSGLLVTAASVNLLQQFVSGFDAELDRRAPPLERVRSMMARPDAPLAAAS